MTGPAYLIRRWSHDGKATTLVLGLEWEEAVRLAKLYAHELPLCFSWCLSESITIHDATGHTVASFGKPPASIAPVQPL